MPKRPRWGLVRVHGPSMEPTLRAGDRLLASYARPPRAGDVVVVRRGDGVVAVKRLTSLADGMGTVESDNRGAEGAWSGVVAVADVLAVVRARLWPRPGPIRRPA